MITVFSSQLFDSDAVRPRVPFNRDACDSLPAPNHLPALLSFSLPTDRLPDRLIEVFQEDKQHSTKK